MTRSNSVADEQAQKRPGSSRTAFRIFPDLSLFVIVGAPDDSEASQATLAAFETTVRAASSDDFGAALSAAGRRARDQMLGLRGNKAIDPMTDGGFAALLVHDGRAHIAWCGMCSVHRLRGGRLQSFIKTGSYGSGKELLDVTKIAPELDLGDTFVLATDGQIRTVGDATPENLAAEIEVGTAAAPMGCAVAWVLAHGKATALAVRLTRTDATERLDSQVRDALRAWSAKTGREGIELRRVQVRVPDGSAGSVQRNHRLELTFWCNPLLGQAAAETSVSSFVQMLQETRPDLGGVHDWDIEIGVIEDAPALEQRKEKVRAFTEAFLKRFRGMLLADEIEVLPAWGPVPMLRVLVLRDDVSGADNEDEVAYELSLALAEHEPELARTVEIDAEYCK